ncbi:MAG: hypothetical protein ACLFV7_03725 [Phycisphaerae bacterium]
MLRRAVLILLGLLLAAPVLAPADEDKEKDSRSKEQKLVDELYSDRISKARSSAGEDDNLSLARELLMAANDESHPKSLRSILAAEALKLTVDLGTESGTAMAEKSLATLDALGEMDDARKAKIRCDIAANRYQRAITKHGKSDTTEPLAREAVKAYLAFIEAAAGEPDLYSEAGSAIRSATRLVRAYSMYGLKESLEKATETLKRSEARRNRVSTARKLLKKAKESGDEKDLQAAHRMLAQAALEFDGDIRKAARFIKGSGHPREELVLSVAAFLQDRSKLDKENCLSQIKDLLSMGRGYEDYAQKKIGEAAMLMCKVYLAGDPPAMGASHANLLMLQIKKLLGNTETDKAIKKLADAYKGVAAKVAVLEDGQVRLTYDFSKSSQIKDWQTESGQWAVHKGVLLCRTGNASTTGYLLNKVKFDASKPAKITFTARAYYEISPTLRTFDPTTGAHRYRWYFRQSRSSLYCYAYGESWRSEAADALKTGKTYKWEITTDGKGGFIWTINNKKVHDFKGKARTYYTNLHFSLLLHAYRSESVKNITAYDDLVIEGTPIYPKSADDE